MKKIIGIGLVMAVLIPQLLMAEPAYIQARQAKLFAEPSMKSGVIAVITKGDAVEVVEKQGRWLKVSAGQKEGWVSKLVVSSQPPLKRVSVLAESETDLTQTARRRASSATAAAAARGLRGDERARQSDRDVVNFSALEQMEELSVSEQEAIEFMERPLE